MSHCGIYSSDCWVFSFLNYRNCPEQSALSKAFTSGPLRNTWIYTGISSVAVLAQTAPVTLSLAIPSIMSVQLIVEL